MGMLAIATFIVVSSKQLSTMSKRPSALMNPF
jgi:hypothetical protein